MARTKFKITKLTAAAGLIDLSISEKTDLFSWLNSIVTSTTRSRDRGDIAKLKELVSTEVYESITAGLEKEYLAIKDLVAFRIYTTDNEFIFEVDLIFSGSNLPRAKEAFKTLLKTTSELNGLRGTSDRGDTRYTLAVDVGAGHGDVSDGVHRLIRLIFACYTYGKGEII